MHRKFILYFNERSQEAPPLFDCTINGSFIKIRFQIPTALVKLLDLTSMILPAIPSTCVTETLEVCPIRATQGGFSTMSQIYVKTTLPQVVNVSYLNFLDVANFSAIFLFDTL